MKFVALLALVLLTGCKGEYRETAFMKLSNPPVPTGYWIGKHATYDYLALSYGVWDNLDMQTARKQLLTANPDIKLGTYYNVHSLGEWMKNSPPNSRTGQLWQRLSPYLSYVNGDTASIHAHSFVWDVLDPAARAIAIEELVFYIRDNDLKWVMLDFFSVPLPNLRGSTGALDFDGDNVAHWDDPGEREALRSAFDDYILVLRSLVPSDVLLIPNGTLAMYDPAFSARVDGCYVEGFPAWFYGGGDTGNYVNAFTADFGLQSLPQLTQPSRWATNPPVIMVEDRWDSGLVAYVSLAYDHIVEMKRPREPAVDIKDPIDLSYLGEPRGLATFDGSTLTRDFTNGRLVLKVTPTMLQPMIEGK